MDHRLEDALHEALADLHVQSDAHLATFAAALSPGLGRLAAEVLLRLQRLGPLPVDVLAAVLHLDRAAVEEQVDDLLARGLVVTGPAVHLTPTASEALGLAACVRRGKILDALQDWTTEDRETFTRLLARFVQRDDLAAQVASLSVAHLRRADDVWGADTD